MDIGLETGHRILAVVLILGYAVLAFRFSRASDRTPAFFEKVLAQIVRFSLLLEFVSGIILSVNLHVWVNKWHHWACILPAIALAVHQLYRATRTVSLKHYARIFIAMCAAMMIISLTAILDPVIF